MSLDPYSQVLLGLCAVLILVAVAHAWRSGRVGGGRAAVERASNPADYFLSLALGVGLSAAFTAILAEARFGWAAAQALFALSIGQHALRWLRDGAAGWENAMFDRREEPLQFWLLVAVVAALAAAMAALAAAGAVGRGV